MSLPTPSQLLKRLWRLVMRACGDGIIDLWPVWIIVHDRGVTIAWKQVEKVRIEWRRP